MHYATIIGRLGADAVLKEINGRQFVSMSVARDEVIGKSASGEPVKEAIWYNVTLHGNGGNRLPLLLRGSMVTVIGRERTNVYQDRNGAWKVGFNIYAFDVYLCGGQKQEQVSPIQQASDEIRTVEIFPGNNSSDGIDDLPM